MKTKILLFLLLISVTFLLMSFSDPYTIKRISDANFRYEFYTTEKKIKTNSNKIYYWFKGGLIHNSQSGMTGELLQDKFVKMYHSNQLAEQGTFQKGLKIGLWKTWFTNGNLQTTQKWRNGVQYGKFFRYDESGFVIENGNFKNGKKHGTWIDYIKKDTVTYKKGAVFIKKVKISKVEETVKKEKSKKTEINPDKKSKISLFFNRLFTKNQTKENKND